MALSRFKKHTHLGWQWMLCGWRLFMRNPWLLGGMGLVGAVLISLLKFIPLLGGSLIAFLAPIVLASFYIAIDRVSKLSMPLPPVLRPAAFKQSPRELFTVFSDERRIMPIVIVSLYAMIVSLLTNTFLWLIAGSAWTKPLGSLGFVGVLAVLMAVIVALICYFFLAISMVYALPRTFLRGKPLFPEMGRSVKAGLHYLFALSTILSVLLVPILIGMVISAVSAWLAYPVVAALNAIALPWVACGLFCSYRTLFQPQPQPATAQS